MGRAGACYATGMWPRPTPLPRSYLWAVRRPTRTGVSPRRAGSSVATVQARAARSAQLGAPSGRWPQNRSGQHIPWGGRVLGRDGRAYNGRQGAPNLGR